MIERALLKTNITMKIKHAIHFFLFKNTVFLAKAEYSYFSVDIRLKEF